MELFYTTNILDGKALLDAAESNHSTRVLRNRLGSRISFTDGKGSLYEGVIVKIGKWESEVEIVSISEGRDKRGYNLHMAVAITKNISRYEWFLEKAVEIGVDRITPLVCDNSERKVLNRERELKIVLSAMKQSLKTTLPHLDETISAKSFIDSIGDRGGGLPIIPNGATLLQEPIKLMGHCREGKREAITKLLKLGSSNSFVVMIGPEGDFSKEEVEGAAKGGFNFFHLGASRLRVESAALTAVNALYLNYLEKI
ncbi:MAG: RsmE family RNA methyltransferase [Bacteroidales bacterium]